MNWDLLNYHFYNGYAMLNGRLDLDIAPAQLQTFLNPLVDVPLYLAIVSLPPIVVGAAYGFVQGLNGLAVWLIGREFLPIEENGRREWVALGLAFLGGLGSINLSEVGGRTADTLVSIPVLFSVAVLLSKRRRLETGPWSVVIGWAGLAGAISGIGVGLKITAALFTIGVALGCLFLVRAFSHRVLAAGAFAVGAVGSWLLLSGFWLWQMWSRFGDPLFPFVRLSNSRPEFDGIVASLGTRMPTSAVRAAFYPFVWAIDSSTVSEARFRDWHLPVLYLLLAALAVRWCVLRARQGWRIRGIPGSASAFLLVGAVVSYAIWLSRFGVYRYLAPLEWLAPLGITVALMALVRARYRTVAILVVLALTTLTTRPANYGRAGWAGSYFGVETPQLKAGTSRMVLIAGLNGLSFLVPHFPVDVRFIRLQSNAFLYGMALGGFYGEGQAQNHLDEIVRDAVASHQGDIYVLVDGLSERPADRRELSGAYDLDAVLWKLRLRLRTESCQPVRLFKFSSPPWAFLRPGYEQHALRPATAVCETSRAGEIVRSPVFHGVAGRIARLYFAYFQRAPDDAGLEYWLARSKAGASLGSISEALATTPEFQSRYGSLNNTQFVTLIYRNLLGRDPDPSGFAYWVGQLNSAALSRPRTVLDFSQSPEFEQIFSLAGKGR